jgi:hypothetical protein
MQREGVKGMRRREGRRREMPEWRNRRDEKDGRPD